MLGIIHKNESSSFGVYVFFAILITNALLIFMNYTKIMRILCHNISIVIICILSIIFRKIKINTTSFKKNKLYTFSIICCLFNLLFLFINRFAQSFTCNQIVKMLSFFLNEIWPEFQNSALVLKNYFRKFEPMKEKNIIEFFSNANLKEIPITNQSFLVDIKELTSIESFKINTESNFYKNNFILHVLLHICILFCMHKCTFFYTNFIIFGFVILSTTFLNEIICVFNHSKSFVEFAFLNKIKKFLLMICFIVYAFYQTKKYGKLHLFASLIVFFLLLCVALYFINKKIFMQTEIPLIVKFLYENYIHIIFSCMTFINLLWIFYVEYKSFSKYVGVNYVQVNNNKATF